MSKITKTNNYRLFNLSSENRSLDLKAHQNLRKSMQQNGFLPCFPVVCKRGGDKRLIVVDGQHRLAIAEELGLQVIYMVIEASFDVPDASRTNVPWKPKHYAENYAGRGNEAYVEGLAFMDKYRVPISKAFGLLGGTTTFSNISGAFCSGKFKVTDRAYANKIGEFYVAMIGLSPNLKRSAFLDAVIAAGRIPGFDFLRCLCGAKQCREKLAKCSTRDGYLDLIELVYNFRRQHQVPVKFEAIQAMRGRSAVNLKMESVR